MSQRAEEPMSAHPGKEGKDLHPSFIPSFFQRALFGHWQCAQSWALPSGQLQSSLGREVGWRGVGHMEVVTVGSLEDTIFNRVLKKESTRVLSRAWLS